MSDHPLPRERVPYSAIADRPPLKLPDGARMAVWTIVNVEDWGIERPMPRTVLPPPMGQPLLPDLPNWAWHEYGMRVGFWRLFDCMREFRITPTLAINGIVCKTYPRVAQAAKDAGWEFMGHGWLQQPMHKVDDQPAAIRQTIEAIRAFTGKPPSGWESPGLTETAETIDHLAAAGIDYVANWVLDDQPVYVRTATKPVVSVPYTLELNDIAMMVIQNHAGRGALPARARPVRAPVRRERALDARDGDRDPPVHHRRAAPHPLSRRALSAHPRQARRGALDGRGDRRLVPGGRARSGVM